MQVLYGEDLARISHTLAGAGSVLAAPQWGRGAFRALPIQPVSAAARKTLGTTMPFAIIPQWYEKCGLASHAGPAPCVVFHEGQGEALAGA